MRTARTVINVGDSDFDGDGDDGLGLPFLGEPSEGGGRESW